MAQNTDLYPILRSYANKNHSPYVAIDSFIDVLGKTAKRNVGDHPEWTRWVDDTALKVWEDLTPLVEDGHCQIIDLDGSSRILLLHFYVELVQQSWQNLDAQADLPFYDENSFQVPFPQSRIRPVSVEFDFPSYIEQPQESILPIIKLIFPGNLGNTLVLANMIPSPLMEAAILKIRNLMRSHNNKEYFLHKLIPAFQGKETQLREALNQIVVKPFEALRIMRDSGEFIFLFWAYFNNLLKHDINQKKEPLPAETGALQSVYIIEVFNNYYKGIAVRKKEQELALKNLELQLGKPPFLYTLDDIIKFVDHKGIPLLGQYSQEALEHYLKTKTTEAKEDELPEMLIVHGLQDERWFVKKIRMLPLCARLLADARVRIRRAISKRWLRLLKQYQNEYAMDNDEEFEKLLQKYLYELAPTLGAVLGDQKLYLAYCELEKVQGGIPESSRIYIDGVLIPLASLLLIRRKDILTDTRMLLPFWYTVPIISEIIAFFKNWGKQRNLKKRRRQKEQDAGEEDLLPAKQSDLQQHRLRAAAQELRDSLIPDGYTLDSYLALLHDRWNRLLGKQAKKNLTEDIHSLIRDRLRHTLRIQPNAVLTEASFSRMADKIIMDTPTLSQLSAQDSLKLYIQLYMVKNILNIKFSGRS
ncbi:MAG: hypothetical protein LBI85_05495 [Spirochaetaceae bacterium]|jgi:hypothetical protein|nr:hypothetical protein [Spirochaetaceae bacterium]